MDASYYGMGENPFSNTEGIKREVPSRFLEKSLNDRMSRWSTSQKEGYAIYYANMSGEYLLRTGELF